MKLFSNNLIVLRTVWNLSQLELAKKFGVVGPSYSRWENGTEPKFETLVEIAKYFKISIDRLLTEELTPETCPPRWGKEEEKKPAAEGQPLLTEAMVLQQVLERMGELEKEHERLRTELRARPKDNT